MIRVLHILSSIGTTGGVQSMLWNYYKHMDSNDIRFDFISLSRELTGFEKKFTEKGSKIYFAVPQRKSIIRNIFDINKVICMQKYDVVHCHQDFMGYIAMILAWCNGVKVRIIHAHNANKKENIKQKVIHKIFARVTSLFATDVWGCSENALLWSFSKKICAEKNATIINNAIDVNNYKYNSSVREKIRSDLGITNECKIVGCVGRFTKQKNWEFLIEIFEKLHNVDSSYKLMMVGDGELFDKIMNTVKAKKLSDSVFALGSRTDVNELMQAMDLFVLPSIFEGLGIVFIEAQCSNLCCFASDAVPKEANITGSMQYIGLDKPARVWADKILSTDIKTRKDNTDIVTKKGYNIGYEAEKLVELYYKLIERNKKCQELQTR